MTDAPGTNYGYKCRNCPAARNYGAARLRAEIESGKHSRRHVMHVVDLTKTVILHTFSAKDNQMELPDGEMPPF